MANVSEKVADHLESLDADELLLGSAQVEKIDAVARRIFGLDTPASGSGAVNLNVLSGGRAIVQSTRRTSSNPLSRPGRHSLSAGGKTLWHIDRGKQKAQWRSRSA